LKITWQEHPTFPGSKTATKYSSWNPAPTMYPAMISEGSRSPGGSLISAVNNWNLKWWPDWGKVPGKITDYSMVIQCGACMITRKQLINRLKPAVDAGVPVTNYGMAIAYMHGIYERAVAPFAKLDPGTTSYL
jgi:hypothetical protein